MQKPQFEKPATLKNIHGIIAYNTEKYNWKYQLASELHHEHDSTIKFHKGCLECDAQL